MYVRAVEEAESRLSELRRDELSTVGLSVGALLCSLLSTQLLPAAAVPLFVGGASIGFLGIRAMWRHWDFVDRMADEPDAYGIAEVRAYAARDATMARRVFYAETIRGWMPPEITRGRSSDRPRRDPTRRARKRPRRRDARPRRELRGCL